MGLTHVDRILRGALVLAAVLFGALTIIAGSRVLAGFDPGYVVFEPLLIFNTLMGVAYVAAGAIAWRDAGTGKHVAGAILGVNALALSAVVYLYGIGRVVVAADGVRAMTLRTVVWAVLLAGLVWLDRRDRSTEER